MNHPEDIKAFAKFYEWAFKILGWLTALGALKFAYIKTGHTLFFIIYVIFICLWVFPVGTVLFFQFDLPQIKYRLLKRALGRLPSLALIYVVGMSVNWMVTRTVDEIANIQITASCKSQS